MNLASSVLTQDALPQVDGRVWVTETHTFTNGEEVRYTYLKDAATDANALLATRAAALPNMYRDNEIDNNINQIQTLGSLAQPTFDYSNVAANAAAIRAAYKTAERLQAVMIGDYLSSLTNGQLQTAFGLTAGQVTTLRTNKLTPAANQAASIRSAVGQ